jgi:cytochrome d ubiquinol oxidase subunit II
LGAAAAVVAVAFLVWTQALTGDTGSGVLFVVAALALVAGLVAALRGREGWAFLGTMVTIALAVAGLFAALFPDVMPSTTNASWSLTTSNASATDYTLTVMTWVAVVFTPVVLLYQGWTYWVFRRRIAVHHIPVTPPPGPRDAVAAGR